MVAARKQLLELDKLEVLALHLLAMATLTIAMLAMAVLAMALLAVAELGKLEARCKTGMLPRAIFYLTISPPLPSHHLTTRRPFLLTFLTF
jgi:hypothetical protein|tara:strand:+ start:170 stop:442 length:273 start_codon:yes stop_codon:yes gene_type:complete